MKTIFLLSKGHAFLAKEEVLALSSTKKYELIENLLILDTSFKDYKRLAYTKEVYNLLFESNNFQLNKKIKTFDWNKIYKAPFCVRVHHKNKSLERDFAELIWGKLKNPKVNLTRPKTEIHFFFLRRKIICAVLKEKLPASEYDKRRPHLRPEMHPSSLNPRLARAMVNLTGIKKGTIVDPFCGTGGILLEAGLIGLNAEGYDIDEKMLEMGRKNLEHFKISPLLKRKDATEISKKMDYVVSDLPYGKATKSQDMNILYKKFLKLLKSKLQKKAVLGFPDFIEVKPLINSIGLKIEKEFDFYIHKSLSKKIFVLS